MLADGLSLSHAVMLAILVGFGWCLLGCCLYVLQLGQSSLALTSHRSRAWGMGHRLQSELSCGVLGYMGFCQSLGSPPCFQEVYAKFEKMCTNSMQSCSIWLCMMCVQHVCMLSWHHDIIHTPAGHCMYILCATA